MALTRLGTNAITSVPSSAITALPAGVGGSVVKLITTTSTGSATNIDFNSTYINDNYYNYILYMTDLKPNTNAPEAYIKFSSDNGSSFMSCTSTRTYRNLGINQSGNEFNSGDFVQLATDAGNQSGFTGSYIVELMGLRSSNYKWGMYRTSAKHSVGEYNWGGGFEVLSNSVVNFLRFTYSSGTISDNAKFTLYGVTR